MKKINNECHDLDYAYRNSLLNKSYNHHFFSRLIRFFICILSLFSIQQYLTVVIKLTVIFLIKGIFNLPWILEIKFTFKILSKEIC